MTPPRVRHRLVIRHPSDSAVLLVDSTGSLRLPSFVSDDRHTAEADYINAAAWERFRLATTVLRSLSHSEPREGIVDRVHELAVHGAVPAGLDWCARHALTSRAPDDGDAIASWLAAPDRVADGSEWTRPGWFEEASDWIRTALRDVGVREIVQLRVWMSSCVLRVRSAGGDFYFKAVPESLRAEAAVTAYLARHFPGTVARVVASEPEWRWFLMAALPGRTLEDVADVTAWEQAIGTYAQLQAACAGRVADLRSLGCPTRTLAAVAEGIASLASDATALRIGEPDGLTTAEVERFRSIAPALRQRCTALAALDIPLTLEHGDLWPSNFLVDGTTSAIIDWEDVAIGDPFLSLAPFLAGLGMSQPQLQSPEVVERIERAYLRGFAGSAPSDRLRRALRLAAPLAFVDLALRYRGQRPSVVRLHPWMRDLVPQSLRLALTALAADDGGVF